MLEFMYLYLAIALLFFAWSCERMLYTYDAMKIEIPSIRGYSLSVFEKFILIACLLLIYVKNALIWPVTIGIYLLLEK